jgi:hypothetical protein
MLGTKSNRNTSCSCGRRDSSGLPWNNSFGQRKISVGDVKCRLVLSSKRVPYAACAKRKGERKTFKEGKRIIAEKHKV